MLNFKNPVIHRKCLKPKTYLVKNLQLNVDGWSKAGSWEKKNEIDLMAV